MRHCFSSLTELTTNNVMIQTVFKGYTATDEFLLDAEKCVKVPVIS